MTEAEIDSRCLPFDESTMAAFRKGQPVLWVWDPFAELTIGRQEQSHLTNAMRDALAARTQKALTVISILRDHDPVPDTDLSSNPEYFKKLYFKIVLKEDPDPKGNYTSSDVPFFSEKGKAFKVVYGQSPIHYARNLKEELPFFDHFYGKKPQRTEFHEYEFYILEILYRGYLRARDVEAAQHDIRRSLKESKRSYGLQHAQANGKTHNYELSTFEYFLIALHSGYNPQYLHPGLAKYHRHLAVAAWLGRLGHWHSLLLPPELCEPLLELLDSDTPLLCGGVEESTDIRDLLQRHAEMFAGIRELTAIAEQVLKSGQGSVVPRRIYGRITQGRRKNELLEFTPETVPPDVALRASQTNERAAGSFKLVIGGEVIVVRPFLPLAW